jgi:hypothetical protein
VILATSSSADALVPDITGGNNGEENPTQLIGGCENALLNCGVVLRPLDSLANGDRARLCGLRSCTFI